MIWLIMGILVLGVLLFVARPLYVKQAPKNAPDSETTDYLEKISQIDAQLEAAGETVDVPVLEAAKIELQRQIIKHNNVGTQIETPPPALLLSSLFVIFAFAAIGLYTMGGRPDLTTPGALQRPVQLENPADMTLEQAVARLEQKLKTDGQNPQGWILYARSLITLRRYDDAVAAYEKALQLADNNPNVKEELASAKQFIAQQTNTAPPGPSAQQMQDAANMTAQDRQDMINSMVAGLAEKLKDNPKNPDGWIRLLKARRVMGQEAKADITLIRETFKDNPKTIEQILSASGWTEEK